MRKVLLLFLSTAVLAACSTQTSGSGGPEASGITVVGTNGDRVLLEAIPSRIVSLSATHTETLFAIGAGDQVVGTDLTSDHPLEVAALPKVDAFNFDVEEVAALEPDLAILAFDSFGEISALERVGIPALVLGPATDIEEMNDQIMTVGLATGHRQDAEELVEALNTRMEAVFETRDGEGMRVYHELDTTLYSPNSQAFLGELFSRFGLINIADQVPDELGSGYVQLSAEFILSQDPDLIFLGDADFGESIDTLAERPGWKTLSAVQAGTVYPLDADISSRWGPRTADLVEAIASAVQDAAS